MLKLQRGLCPLPVVTTVARIGKGKEKLIAVAEQIIDGKQKVRPLTISYGKDIDPALADMEAVVQSPIVNCKGVFIMETMIVFVIVGICCVYIGRKFYKNMTAKPSSSGCGGGCASCAMHASGCEPPQCVEIKSKPM